MDSESGVTNFTRKYIEFLVKKILAPPGHTAKGRERGRQQRNLEYSGTTLCRTAPCSTRPLRELYGLQERPRGGAEKIQRPPVLVASAHRSFLRERKILDSRHCG